MLIEISEKDFDHPMDWESAQNACISMGNGWRLPTQKELAYVYQNYYQLGKGDLKAADYWSSIEYDLEGAWYYSFIEGSVILGTSTESNDGFDFKFEEKWVRAVRDIPSN
jgi:hypothetical protein